MKLFRRKSSKSGYCNISEPVSDLDPARISKLKAQHSILKKAGKEEEKNSTVGNDDTFITETITLDTSPSAESSKAANKRQQVTSGSTVSVSSPQIVEKKVQIQTPETCKPETNRFQVVSSSNTQEKSMLSPELMVAKTPDTFFQGKNRKRVSIKLDSTSQAPTEHPIAVLSSGEKRGDFQVAQIPQTVSQKAQNDSRSQTSDLDKTFAPQIVSVNSDITDPSYGWSSRRKKKQQSWRKLKSVRRYLHETLNSNSESTKSPMTFLEVIVDAICSYPASKN